MQKRVLGIIKSIRKGVINKIKISSFQTRYIVTKSSSYKSVRIPSAYYKSKYHSISARACSTKPNGNSIENSGGVSSKSGVGNGLLYGLILGGFGVGGYYYYYMNNNKVVSTETIMKFWFGELKSSNDIIEKSTFMKWYMGGKDFDEEIANKFGKFMVECLETDKYKHWENDPIGCLCLIIVADQFTRNVYRGTTKAFKYDKYAQNLCLKSMDKGFDNILYVLHPVFCNFFYSPLLHGETMELQDLCLKKHTELLQRLKEDKHPYYKTQQMVMTSVNDHRNWIIQFGRFPHRNKIFGRESTQNEIDFIEAKGLNKLVERK